jgi:4-diphosphocytidyl-2-C-methyl-D-erythritol kinase
MLTVRAPAKINLTLEVLGKRPDGFHEIRSVIQTIKLYDELLFEAAPQTQYITDLSDWESGKSLIVKAAALIRKTAKITQDVRIKVTKRIPLVSGLGGDSSDAAATLNGLNRLWELGLTGEKLQGIAEQLGSDVPFFISGGTALMAGKGEKITPLPPPEPTWIVLIIPAVPRIPDKTSRLYSSLWESQYTEGTYTANLVKSLQEKKKIEPDLLFNTFENVAFDPCKSSIGFATELYIYRSHIMKIGAPNLHLAGSGPSLFSLVKDKAAAEDLATRLKNQGMEAYALETAG